MTRLVAPIFTLLFLQLGAQTNTFPSTGNVGIGTTVPQYGKLHINGNGPDQGINLWTNSGETTSRLWINNQTRTFHLSKGNNPENGITLDNNGKIGIGTASPVSTLHVSSGTSGDAVLRLEADTDNNMESDNPMIQMRQDGDIIGINMGFSEAFGDNKFGIGTRYTNAGADKWNTFIVDVYTGNIGIGTQNPGSHKLAVNGNIRAKEIKVETGWADYVFSEDYDLPTLKEVERHIQEKGHLINIPSAKEVKANGIQLGEMNKLLLEKIEELTLYTIAQEKRIQQITTLQEQNKILTQRVEALEKTVKQLVEPQN